MNDAGARNVWYTNPTTTMKSSILHTLLAAVAVITPCKADLAPPQERAIVLISVDGLAHFYLDDPKCEMPNIRQLAKEGARAEKMRAVMPTVTWPNHTSVVTGVHPVKHGVVGNSFYDREKKTVVPVIWDPLLNKEEIIKVPTIYDVAKQAGFKTAAVTWPGSRAARNLDWQLPCVNKSDLFVQYSTPSLLEEFKQVGIPYEDEAKGFKEGEGENRDRLHVRMLKHILRTHRPHLTLMHILEVDHIEHAHGPQTPEAYAAVKFADGLIGEIKSELEQIFPEKATIVLVSDHGFLPYKQFIQPNVLLRKKGLLTAFGSKITGGKARAVSQGGACMIYVDDKDNRDAIIAELSEEFKNTEGVTLVLTKKDFPKYGFADPDTQSEMGDIVLSAKSGYSFSDVAGGEDVITKPTPYVRGMHGYDPNDPKLHATFVAWGAGIKPGSNAGTMTNTDVAPTIASLLGLKMQNVEGKPLEAILQK